MEVLIELAGLTPLVMHNIRLADPEDAIVRAIGELTSKKKNKTDADLKEIEHLEFLGGLYYDTDIGVHVPSRSIIRCFEQAGAITRAGTSVVRAVSVLTDRFPLTYAGPGTPEELYQKTEHRFRMSVGVQRAKIMRMRPMFRTWKLDFSLELAEDILNPREFAEIVARAGRSVGLGDARKLGNGRFESAVHYDES
jgi:hypothetical protein